MKYDYPIDDILIEQLRQEYRDEAIDKGNSWKKECSINYLFNKLQEEFNETLSAKHRNFPNRYIQSEILDLILVAGMLFWRLEEVLQKGETKE